MNENQFKDDEDKKLNRIRRRKKQRKSLILNENE